MSFGRLGSLGRGYGRLGGGGGSVSVVISGIIVAGGGSYAWTGADAFLIQNHIIAASADSYIYTGQDATLTKSSLTTTWNSADKNAGIALSGGDLTATRSGGSSDAGVRAIASTSTSKVYWEITAGTIGATASNAVGIANASWNLTWITNGSNAGSWGANNIGGGGFASYTTGDVLCFALDATARLMWRRKNGGSWEPSGDPALGTGGQSVSGVTGALYAASFSNPNGNGHTANFGATAYTQTPPSGFGNW